MDTLNITKEAAVKAHDNAKPSGKELLEHLFGKKIFQKEVTDRIKSFSDVLEAKGLSLNYWNASCVNSTADEIAYRQIKLIAEVLNEGWQPDWGNSNEYKYYPWFDMGGSSGSGFSCVDCVHDFSHSGVGSRLCFKSAALAKYAGTQFTDIYKQLYIIS